jgi:hypothetical protein
MVTNLFGIVASAALKIVFEISVVILSIFSVEKMESQSVSDNNRLYSSKSHWLYSQILRLNDLLTGLGAFKKPMTGQW